jgi:hypothetical protein
MFSGQAAGKDARESSIAGSLVGQASHPLFLKGDPIPTILMGGLVLDKMRMELNPYLEDMEPAIDLELPVLMDKLNPLPPPRKLAPLPLSLSLSR